MKKYVFLILLTILTFGGNGWAQIRTEEEWVKNPETNIYSFEQDQKYEKILLKEKQKKIIGKLDLETIAKGLYSEDKLTKINTADILSYIPENTYILKMEDMLLNDPSDEVRYQCANSLLILDSKSSIPVLILALNDINRNVKLQVALALAVLGEKEKCASVIDLLWNNGNADAPLYTCHLVFLYLATPDAINKLTYDLNSIDKYIAIDAAIILAQLGYYKEAFPFLKSRLNDNDKYLRMAALRGLAYIGTNNAIELIKSKLNDNENMVRERASSILKNCNLSFLEFNNEATPNYITITYNPSAAAAYADYWTYPESDLTRHNPAFHYYTNNDCSNFVSQCLIEGGLNLRSGPGLDPYGEGCIPACDNLHQNLTTYQGCTYSSSYSGHKTSSYPTWFVQGDVVLFGADASNPNDPWQHAAINVVTGTPALDAHTNNRYHKSVGYFYPSTGTGFKTGDFYHFNSTGSGGCTIANITPTLVSPGTSVGPGTIVSTTTPTLSWNPVAGATNYDVYISISPYGSSNIKYQQTCVSGTSLTIPAGYLTNGNLYRWNIQANVSCGSCVSLNSSPLYFQTQTTGTLTVTYPNGGETLIKGQNYNVTWNYQNISSNIQIDLYKGNANVLQLAASASNNGSYQFNPPSYLVDGNDYKIGISAMNGTVSDFSNNNFTISSPATTPTVTTTTATSITNTTASSGGNVTSDGGATVTARGVCWSTSSNPTIANDHTSNGTGNGSFTSSITGLSSGTLYHYRAYATNSAGTSYGSDLTFTTTSSTPTITVSTTSLSDFGSLQVGANSTPQTYTISGSNLIANIAVEAPSGFQVSTNSSSGFGSSLTLTQSGGTVSSTTIYARFSPTSTGFQSGNIAHTSTGATNKSVSVSGTSTAVSTPTIIISTSSLDFGNLVVGQNSSVQSYNVSGSNLTANIILTTPSEFQISTNSSTGFVSSLTLTQSGGTVSNTTLYARFNPTSTGLKSGNIVHTSTGATTKNVSISGTGTQPTTSGTWELIDSISLSGSEYVRHLAISGGKAYVTRGGAYTTVVDLSSKTELTNVAFSPYPTCNGGYVAVFGNRAYVALSNLGSNGQMAVINTDNNTVVTYVPVGTDPWGVATYNNKVYVTNNVWWTNGDPATVKVVNMSNNTIDDTIFVGINPSSIAIDPTTGKAFVTNRNSLSKSVSVINTTSNTVITTISMPNEPSSVAISGNHAYVANSVNWPSGTVEVIDVSSNSVTTSIPVGRDACNIAANSGFVFVVNQSSRTMDVIDISSNAVVATVNVGNDPLGVAVDLTTNKVYVTNQVDRMIKVIGQKQTHSIIANSGANGTITPSGSISVSHGADQSFTITPNANYHIADVLVDGSSVGAVTSYAFTNVTSNHSISASFVINAHSLTINVIHGTVTKDPNQASYNHGTNVQLTATPSSGYHFVNWSGDANGTENPLKLTMDANKTLTANFIINTYAINATSGPNGIIIPSGVVLVNYGNDKVFTFTPNTNYKVDSVIVDGSLIVSAQNYGFYNVVENHSISVWFGTVTSVDQFKNPIPSTYSLYQNYPNPFNPTTTIKYDLPRDAVVKIVIFDVLGRPIKTLVDEQKSAGSYRVEFDANTLSSGVYFYQLQTSEFTQIRKLILMR